MNKHDAIGVAGTLDLEQGYRIVIKAYVEAPDGHTIPYELVRLMDRKYRESLVHGMTISAREILGLHE
jgi:hypothetical protein